MSELDFSNPLFVFAMVEESQDVFDERNILHTGIGKVNAAYSLTKYLREKEASVIINMGTAGSRKHEGGTIVNATTFIQRDMDVTPLGFEKFQTPFSNDPVRIESGIPIEHLRQGVCGTGDNFDISDAANDFDVVDMEAYALALIAQRENVPFLCLKYISDGAGDGADQDWNAALHRAAEALRLCIQEIEHG